MWRPLRALKRRQAPPPHHFPTFRLDLALDICRRGGHLHPLAQADELSPDRLPQPSDWVGGRNPGCPLLPRCLSLLKSFLMLHLYQLVNHRVDHGRVPFCELFALSFV